MGIKKKPIYCKNGFVQNQKKPLSFALFLSPAKCYGAAYEPVTLLQPLTSLIICSSENFPGTIFILYNQSNLFLSKAKSS